MTPNRMTGKRLIIVSNRLPITLTRKEGDEWQIKPGSGGLVTAMAPVLRDRGGLWIGWPGTMEEISSGIYEKVSKENEKFGYDLKPVSLTRADVEAYYKGFANEIIWPLFHDLIDHSNFDPEYWDAYEAVNGKFADVIIHNLSGDDFIWVHDYHLMNVAAHLRDKNLQGQIAFFLHIPFPPPDIFVRLPWRFEILNALLQYDLIGFQTMRDRRNFLQCIRTFLHPVRAQGKGQVVRIDFEDREVRIGAFPISIDYHEFRNLAETKDVGEKAWLIHEKFPERQIILGIDRLDYTKGILERLSAFRQALRLYPEIRGKASLVQVVVPSRRDIPEYANLKEEIERLVGEINGEFTQSHWVPIYYMFRSLPRPELLAYYRTAEIALLTPLKDGMNLVAKEYCACQLERTGVLILSEFAGSAAQFQQGALLINPHDINGTAAAIREALNMPKDERRRRMEKLRRNVRRYDIFWWVDSFLEAAIARHLDSFPRMEDYIPRENP
ncbi:MAG: trehalose-6-phosphate synthase [Calditrichia bacterium]